MAELGSGEIGIKEENQWLYSRSQKHGFETI